MARTAASGGVRTSEKGAEEPDRYKNEKPRLSVMDGRGFFVVWISLVLICTVLLTELRLFYNILAQSSTVL